MCYEEGELLGSNWSDGKFSMDHNLYYNTTGNPVTFAGASLEEWRKGGHDGNSIVADPLFVDAAKRNFTLRPESPAFKLGFRNIDLSTVGPVDDVGPR